MAQAALRDGDALLVLNAILGPVMARPEFESELLSMLKTRLRGDTRPSNRSHDPATEKGPH